MPKSQITFSKIVITNSYATLLTFTSFSIKFRNFIRVLNFEETKLLCYLKSKDAIIDYIAENIKIQHPDIQISFSMTQNLFVKYLLPETITIDNEIDKIIIQFPTLVAYFQDSGQIQQLQMNNQEVIHLIDNKFQTIQQYCQRINFNHERIFIRSSHAIRVTKMGIDVYDSCTQKQILVKQSKNFIDLTQKILKQVCSLDLKYAIINLIPPQLVLKQLKKQIVVYSFSLLEFYKLCHTFEKIQLETFLMMIKLQKTNDKPQIMFELDELPKSNEISQSCLRNGLLTTMHKSINCDLNYFQIEYVPVKLMIYEPDEQRETNMTLDYNLIEQLLIHKLKVEFTIY